MMSMDFKFGDGSLEVLRDLFPVFGVKSYAECLERCASFAQCASKYADARGYLHVGKDENAAILMLRGEAK